MAKYNLPAIIQKAAVEAVEKTDPCATRLGTVISTSPLKIQVDQKTIYTSKMLILTRNVTDFNVDMTVNHQTEDTAGGSGDASFDSHHHTYSGRKTFRVHNGLTVGEKVLMLTEGKRVFVLDRIKPNPTLMGD